MHFLSEVCSEQDTSRAADYVRTFVACFSVEPAMTSVRWPPAFSQGMEAARLIPQSKSDSPRATLAEHDRYTIGEC